MLCFPLCLSNKHTLSYIILKVQRNEHIYTCMCVAVRDIINTIPDWNWPCPPVPCVLILSFFHTGYLLSQTSTLLKVLRNGHFLMNWSSESLVILLDQTRKKRFRSGECGWVCHQASRAQHQERILSCLLPPNGLFRGSRAPGFGMSRCQTCWTQGGPIIIYFLGRGGRKSC